ncbi:hypothetical protein LWI28_017354 [Acer negundo]|uniref:Uncharacterized protein n=1 Tax=Acer negundo TaxID=4023 RepID=A0AAD5JM57_ACENE|nr:hypothetical protein LWI28_017354 [Acer negundo]
MTPTKRIVYTTTRPTDIKTLYEKMLDNQVEFGSPDKRSGGFLNSSLATTLEIGNHLSNVLDWLNLLHHNTHRFVSNSISFPPSVGVNQLKSHERFNLWTGPLYSSHKLRETKTLASSQDGDSSEKSDGESSSSQAPSQSTQSSGTGSGSSTNQKREKQNKSGGY